MLGGTGSCLFIEILKKKTTTRFRGLWEVNSHKLLKVEFILTIGPYLPPFMSSANSNSFKACLIYMYLYQTRIPQEVKPLKDHVYTTGVVCQFVSSIINRLIGVLITRSICNKSPTTVSFVSLCPNSSFLFFMFHVMGYKFGVCETIETCCNRQWTQGYVYRGTVLDYFCIIFYLL